MLTLLVVTALLASPPPPAPLPVGIAATAAALTEATTSFAAQIDQRSRDVPLWALRQQRLYLALGLARPQFADAVLARLPARLRADARDVLEARHALVRLTPPTTRPLSSFRTGPAVPAERLLAYYRAAERRFGVPWQVLAAMNFVESAFGKLRSPSTAGAQGPMQFLPATWRAYGLGGDVHDPHDAVLGAANYLHASGAPGDLRRALYAYNHSPLYVDAILAYARVLHRNPRAYLEFYAWHVFVRTPSGYRRLTSTLSTRPLSAPAPATASGR